MGAGAGLSGIRREDEIRSVARPELDFFRHNAASAGRVSSIEPANILSTWAVRAGKNHESIRIAYRPRRLTQPTKTRRARRKPAEVGSALSFVFFVSSWVERLWLELFSGNDKFQMTNLK